MNYLNWILSAVAFAIVSRLPIIRRHVSAAWAFELDYSPWRLW